MTYQNAFNGARLAALAAKTNRVAASVTDFNMVGDGVARVVVTLTTDRASQPEIASAIASALDNGGYPVLKSFRRIPGSRTIALAGFVHHNREAITEDDERAKRLRKVTASMLMDPEDESMWEVRKAGDQTMFVRAGSEDLKSLLVTASVRELNTPSLHELASCGSAPGEFLAFASKDGDLKYGFVLASDGETVEVITEDDEEPVEVEEAMVVEAAVVRDELLETAAAVGLDSKDFDSRSKDAMREFYKRVYSYAPAYVDDIMKNIDAHAAV